jgi:hypothetical protein
MQKLSLCSEWKCEVYWTSAITNLHGSGNSMRGKFKFVGRNCYLCRWLVVECWCTRNLFLQVFLECHQETYYLNYGENVNMELEAESLLAIFHVQKWVRSSIKTMLESCFVNK